jgi:hypothetical protein
MRHTPSDSGVVPSVPFNVHAAGLGACVVCAANSLCKPCELVPGRRCYCALVDHSIFRATAEVVLSGSCHALWHTAGLPGRPGWHIQRARSVPLQHSKVGRGVQWGVMLPRAAPPASQDEAHFQFSKGNSSVQRCIADVALARDRPATLTLQTHTDATVYQPTMARGRRVCAVSNGPRRRREPSTNICRGLVVEAH